MLVTTEEFHMALNGFTLLYLETQHLV